MLSKNVGGDMQGIWWLLWLFSIIITCLRFHVKLDAKWNASKNNEEVTHDPRRTLGFCKELGVFARRALY